MSTKCVLIIDPELPLGIIANTGAILGAALGKLHPEINGDDIVSQEGFLFPGIVNIPIPVLKSNAEKIAKIHSEASNTDNISVIAFTDCAQTDKNYVEYTESIQKVQTQDIQFLGICLYGDKKKVNHFAGDLPLLR